MAPGRASRSGDAHANDDSGCDDLWRHRARAGLRRRACRAAAAQRRLEALHRIVHPRRDPQADGARPPAKRRRSIARASATPRSCSTRSTTGSIDVYPEYTGTIAKEILKLDAVPPLAGAQREAWRRWASLSPCRSASTTPTRSRCAATTRARRTSASSPTSRRIPSCGWVCRRNSSAAPTAGRD